MRTGTLMNSSLFLQQCPTCLVRLFWMFLEMGGKWPCNCSFMGCCSQDLFHIARSILLQFPFSFFSIRFDSVHMVHPCSIIVTTAALKKSLLILSNRSDFYMIDKLSIAVHAFVKHNVTSISVDETLLPRYVNFSTYFRRQPLRVEKASFRLK